MSAGLMMMCHLVNAREGADAAVGLRVEGMDGVHDDNVGLQVLPHLLESFLCIQHGTQ
jgi:hypothetical protein